MSKIRKYPTSGVGSDRAVFRYNKLNYSRGQTYTYFQNNTIHSFRSVGNKTLYQELPPHIHTDTYLHIHRLKKGNSCIYLSQINAYSFSYVSYHLTCRYPSLVLFPVCRSSPKHPHFALPEVSYHAPAECGMAIREQT